MGTEEKIASLVVRELQAHRYDTFEEVSLGWAERRADIVAQGPAGDLTVVEVKRSVTLTLVDQAAGWIGYANRVVMAVGSRPRPSVIRAVRHFCRSTGVGLWVAVGDLDEVIAPRFHRRRASRLENALCDAQKTGGDYANAGAAAGGHWSPFQETKRRIVAEVERRPGITVKELMQVVDHHYSSLSSARSCVLRWIRDGVIGGVRLEGTRPLRLYPDA